MTWSVAFRLRRYLRESLWMVPLVGFVGRRRVARGHGQRARDRLPFVATRLAGTSVPVEHEAEEY